MPHPFVHEHAPTIKDVAKILNVNERTVYRPVQRGELPAFKVAGAWRLLAGDVDRWIDSQKAVTADEAGRITSKATNG